MEILDSGHQYYLDTLDGDDYLQRLVFVKREGDNYPGNVGSYSGTNCQEVIRALIDRFKYLQNQIPCDENIQCISYLRGCLYALEIRAAKRHKRTLSTTVKDIELLPTCKICGHVEPEKHNHTGKSECA